MSLPQLLGVPYDYASALGLLYDRINYEKTNAAKYDTQNFRLDRMRELLNYLGQPHLNYPIVHIAGTKGKGTTATLLYDALRANGRRVGLYTSPHLVRLEERFQFDGLECAQSEFVSLCRTTLEAAHRVEAAGLGHCTFFELTTAMGLLHFANCRADSVILEVGLGGRLDSTNVCTPVLSMITSISMDHQAQLGNTLTAIAGEKAGIIKQGIPVISTARAIEARQVIQCVAEQQLSQLRLIDRDFEVEWSAHAASNSNVDLFRGKRGDPTKIRAIASVEYAWLGQSQVSRFARSTWPTRMLGRHHADNIAGVVAALQWLADEAGWQLDLDRSRQAIAQSHPSARLEIIGSNPIRIIDTAHNPVSISAGLQALDDHFSDHHRIVVFACSRDKDYRSMLQHILPHCQHLICTAFQTNPRAVAAEHLAEVVDELRDCSEGVVGNWPLVEIASDPQAAWVRAVETCPRGGLAIAMGSFFLAAELFAFLQK